MICAAQGAQDIVVSKACPPQEIHRDHQLGAKKAIVVAISDGSPLGIEVIRGTHAGRRLDLSAYVAPNRYSSKRAPKAAAMIEHLKVGRHDGRAVGGMVQHPFVYHRERALRTEDGRPLVHHALRGVAVARRPEGMRSTNDIKLLRRSSARRRPAADSSSMTAPTTTRRARTTTSPRSLHSRSSR